MEVVIRLQRIGKRANKRSNFRIVAMSKKSTREGRHLELLGHYDPSKKPATFSINLEKLDKWVKNGARLSDTINSLVKKSKKKT